MAATAVSQTEARDEPVPAGLAPCTSWAGPWHAGMSLTTSSLLWELAQSEAVPKRQFGHCYMCFGIKEFDCVDVANSCPMDEGWSLELLRLYSCFSLLFCCILFLTVFKLSGEEGNVNQIFINFQSCSFFTRLFVFCLDKMKHLTSIVVVYI